MIVHIIISYERDLRSKLIKLTQLQFEIDFLQLAHAWLNGKLN